MPWKAIIRSKEIKGNTFYVAVDAKDEFGAFSETYTTGSPQSDTWIEDIVQAQFDAITALRTFADTIVVGKEINGK